MTDYSIRHSPNFGYESKHIHCKTPKKQSYQHRNIIKVAACIPLIGTCIGLLRIVGAAHQHSDLQKGSKLSGRVKRQYFRGFVEAAGFGIALVPVDLATTARRKYKHWKQNQ